MIERYKETLRAFGVGAVTEASPAITPAEWIAAAQERPAWECWGKGRPSGACPAHPALCHMLDVAAVAALLLTGFAPRALRRRLLAIHPDGDLASLRLLLFVIALHDLGKITPAFQMKLPSIAPLLLARGFDLAAPEGARHHGAAGLGLLRDALVELGLPRREALALARAVTAHHGAFPTNLSLTSPPMGGKERGKSPRWNDARRGAIDGLRALFDVAPVASLPVDHALVMTLAGLTAVADWIGSMDEVFAYVAPQTSLGAYWPVALDRAETALARAGMRPAEEATAKGFEALFPTYTPWPLHLAAEAIAAELDEPALVIVEAPMGEGKTEASLLLANAAAARLGQQGLYVGLPTKATANQMLGRVRDFLARTRPDGPTSLVLAHADADLVETFRSLAAVYDRDDRRGSGVRAETWFLPKKRALLADHAVGTIDQALLGVMRSPHAFVRLYGLAGKTVVLDEVHAYDTYTSTILERLVEWLAALGATVLLLSATLPRGRREALAGAYRRGLGAPPAAPEDVRYPRVTTVARAGVTATPFASRAAPVDVSVERVDDDLEAIARRLVAEVRGGGCVGWICNTVDRAQAAYEKLFEADPETPRLLIHARMLPEERTRRERALEAALGPEDRGAKRPARLVVVGTQVLEQSLDVDFDLLVTDLAPIDLVLQRAGRLHRHRPRSNRAPGHPSPRLWLVHAAGAYDEVPIRDVAVVYAEALVRATLRELAGRATLTLPGDIETLVEAVYRTAPPPASDELFGAYLEHFGRSVAQRQDAERRLVPHPADPDDIFGDLRMPFDDAEDPRLHEDLRAVTRDAEDSVQVVCLVDRAGGVFVDETDAVPLDLTATPDRALAARLARRTIGVSRARVVRSLLNEPSYLPSGWSESAVLRHRRAVAFTDGVAVVGGVRLELDPELGLKIENARTRSAE